MVRRRRHPLTGAIYELRDDGLLQVTTPSGERGVFSADGTWVEGELTHVDPHMCLWIAGPQLPSRHRAALEIIRD